MKIKIPEFEMQEVEIRETYIDENGRYQERIKKVSIPTGKVLDSDNSEDVDTTHYDKGE